MLHKLLFVGDIVLESEPILSTELQSLIAGNDIRSCNVEAPLRGKGGIADKTGPVLNQRADAVSLLKDSGFNLFAMANNHICDYGEEALFHTLAAFGADNTIGVGNEEQAYALRLLSIAGVRYGFLAYGENGYGALNGEEKNGYAWVNHPRVNSDIEKYKQEVDVLIVQVHAGVEMVEMPIPEWRNRYRELIDRGADVVIGHHPHVVQGMEYRKGKPIFYSLGNFYFDGIADGQAWNTGAMVQLEVAQGKLTDFRVYIVKKEGSLLTLMNEDKANELWANRMGKLADDTLYLNAVNTIAIAHWKKHHVYYYAKVVNGLPDYRFRTLLKHFKRLVFNRKINYNMMWHNVLIESNLWIVQRAIQQLYRRK